MFIIIMIMINIIVDKKAEEDASFKYFIHGFLFSRWESEMGNDRAVLLVAADHSS